MATKKKTCLRGCTWTTECMLIKTARTLWRIGSKRPLQVSHQNVRWPWRSRDQTLHDARFLRLNNIATVRFCDQATTRFRYSLVPRPWFPQLRVDYITATWKEDARIQSFRVGVRLMHDRRYVIVSVTS